MSLEIENVIDEYGDTLVIEKWLSGKYHLTIEDEEGSHLMVFNEEDFRKIAQIMLEMIG